MIKIALVVTIAAAVTAAILHTFGSGQDETQVRALVVVGDAANPAAGDHSMIDRLGGRLGYTTEVRDDDQVATFDTTGLRPRGRIQVGRLAEYR